MAHRQLSSLVRRIRRTPVDAPFHRRGLQQPLAADHLIADDFCSIKIGSRFFSKSSSHRRAAGKIANVSKDVVSSQVQSSASQVYEDQSKSGANQAIDDKSISSQALEEQSKSHDSPEKSSSNYILILGVGTALAIGLFAFFPWGLLKNYYIGEQKELDSSSKDFADKAAVLPSKDQEHANEAGKPTKETDAQETAHRQNTEPLKNYFEGTGHPNGAESVALKDASLSPPVDGKISAVKSEDPKIPEVESKDVPFHSTVPVADHLSRADLSSANLPDDAEDQLNLASSKSRDDTVVSTTQTAADFVSSKQSSSMQTPSRSPMKRPNILKSYYLGEVTEPSLQDSRQEIDDKDNLTVKDQLKNSQGEDSMNKLLIDGVQNVLDLLDVVHAAEKRQAELDAQLYKESQKRLKHAFQQELKDAQAKEVMYAEEASRLAKEIEIEKERASASLEAEQKMGREKLSEELKRKEEEAELTLKKAELLSKTEIAAAVAKEKLSYINDVRDVKQELEALYMVLFTQSKDFRQRHTIHKLAVGTFALEDAMKRGAPVEEEVTLICSAYKDAVSDPLLEAIISSLPEQAVRNGTLTPYQLQEKFENLKKGVLELSLIPVNGGGLISHAAAKVVSVLKVKESGRFSDGVSAVISQVQQCLADGKLVDAAELLEKGVHGTKAEGLVADWIENVRERAIMEQMLLLLQAHTTAAASTLA